MILRPILRLRGRSALSAFRLNKLLQSVAPALPSLRVRAEFWHFIQIEKTLDATELARLERVLTYGPHDGKTSDDGVLLLVTPRPGTISPWSSKATDIARHCGLESIQRIERG